MALFSYRQIVKRISWYLPYVGAGIRLVKLSNDFTYCKVRMKMNRFTTNAVGTHFGGSLYSMCDPFFMLLLLETLDRKSYIIWDKAATIRFKKATKETVFAEFHIPMERVEAIRREVEEADGVKDIDFYVEVKDATGNVIAEVDKVVYVRKR